jgi:hypothetical protein
MRKSPRRRAKRSENDAILTLFASPRFWLWSAAGLLVAAAAGWFSLVMVGEDSRPGLSHMLMKSNPRAATHLGDLLLAEVVRAAPKAQAATRSEIEQVLSPPKLPPAAAASLRHLALDGLRGTTLDSGGLRQLAILERDPARRKALLDLALSISRRDAVAILQSSEFALRSNDFDSALDGYDRALRVSPRAGQAVFPVLLAASRFPELRTKLRALLRRDPVWGEDLVRYAIAHPELLPFLSGVVGGLPRGAAGLDKGYGDPIIDPLAVQRRYPEAFAAYAAFSPRPQDPRDPFRGGFPPIDWSLIDEYETSARPLGGPADGIELHAGVSRAGEVARLLTQLAPGPHRLRLKIDTVEGQGGRITATVMCLDGPRERVFAHQASPLAPGTVRLAVSVPARACGYQWVLLSLAAEDQELTALWRAVALD